jgi:hypothetical protein
MGLLAGIEESLSWRFGSEGLALMPVIRQVQDVQQLQTLLKSIRTAASLAEYQQTVAATPTP